MPCFDCHRHHHHHHLLLVNTKSATAIEAYTTISIAANKSKTILTKNANGTGQKLIAYKGPVPEADGYTA